MSPGPQWRDVGVGINFVGFPLNVRDSLQSADHRPDSRASRTLQTRFASIGDAVIETDSGGNIIDMATMAELPRRVVECQGGEPLASRMHDHRNRNILAGEKHHARG